jgi:hypothetical protein
MTNEEMQKVILDLQNQVKVLTDKLTYGKTDANFSEFIRDIVFTSTDTSSSITTTTNVPAGGGNVTFPKVPDVYLRINFRGKPYKFGLYKLSTS